MFSYGFGFFVFQVGLSSISPPYPLHINSMFYVCGKVRVN